MRVNTIEPSPVGEASRDGTLVLDLGHVPAGRRFVLLLPTTVGRRSQAVRLDEGRRLLATLHRRVTVCSRATAAGGSGASWTAILVVQDGRPIERNLRRERLTLAGVMARARRRQVASLDQIGWAVLETGGEISTIPTR